MDNLVGEFEENVFYLKKNTMLYAKRSLDYLWIKMWKPSS